MKYIKIKTLAFLTVCLIISVILLPTGCKDSHGTNKSVNWARTYDVSGKGRVHEISTGNGIVFVLENNKGELVSITK